MGLLNAMAVLAEEWDDVLSHLEAGQVGRLRELVAQFVDEGDSGASADIAEHIMTLLLGSLPVTHPVLSALMSSEDRSRSLAGPAADRSWFQLVEPLRERLRCAPPGTDLTPVLARAAGPSGPSGGAAASSGSGSRAKNPVGGGGPRADPPGRGPAGGGLPQAKRRYLKGQCPETTPVGKPFSLLASIVLAGSGSAELDPFDVPSEGRDVLLVAHAPGLRLLGDQRLTVHVPADGDSRPVMFELRADTPGPRSVSVTAWIGGSYLGELLVEMTAERDHPAARTVMSSLR